MKHLNDLPYVLDYKLPEGLHIIKKNEQYALSHETNGIMGVGISCFIYDDKYARLTHQDGTCTLYDTDGTPLKHAQNVKRCGIDKTSKYYWVDNGKKIKDYMLPETKQSRLINSVILGLLMFATVTGVSKCIEAKPQNLKSNNQSIPVKTVKSLISPSYQNRLQCNSNHDMNS